MFSTRSGASRLALGSVIGLIVLKVAVAVITGSISISAQAVDSFLDLFAIGITLFAVRLAVAPADEEHPFGHGKVEGIAAMVQAVLILTAGGFIIYSAVYRIIEGATIQLTEAGIGVMLVSIVVSVMLSRHLLRVSRTTGSLALEASARNIAADVYSAAGVLVALVVIRFTGLTILDPIIALVVAAFILRAAYQITRKSIRELTDFSLPRAEQEAVISLINQHRDEVAGFHAMRSRKAGNQRFIDLHLVMPRNLSLEEAHRMCDHLEQDLKSRLPDSSITIHVEPCDTECDRCFIVICDMRQGSVPR